MKFDSILGNSNQSDNTFRVCRQSVYRDFFRGHCLQYNIFKSIFIPNTNAINWNDSDIDKIIETGDHLYSLSVSKRQNPHTLNLLNFEEVYRDVFINDWLLYF